LKIISTTEVGNTTEKHKSNPDFNSSVGHS
jgi:hypothetical protein